MNVGASPEDRRRNGEQKEREIPSGVTLSSKECVRFIPKATLTAAANGNEFSLSLSLSSPSHDCRRRVGTRVLWLRFFNEDPLILLRGFTDRWMAPEITTGAKSDQHKSKNSRLVVHFFFFTKSLLALSLFNGAEQTWNSNVDVYFIFLLSFPRSPRISFTKSYFYFFLVTIYYRKKIVLWVGEITGWTRWIHSVKQPWLLLIIIKFEADQKCCVLKSTEL